MSQRVTPDESVLQEWVARHAQPRGKAVGFGLNRVIDDERGAPLANRDFPKLADDVRAQEIADLVTEFVREARVMACNAREPARFSISAHRTVGMASRGDVIGLTYFFVDPITTAPVIDAEAWTSALARQNADCIRGVLGALDRMTDAMDAANARARSSEEQLTRIHTDLNEARDRKAERDVMTERARNRSEAEKKAIDAVFIWLGQQMAASAASNGASKAPQLPPPEKLMLFVDSLTPEQRTMIGPFWEAIRSVMTPEQQRALIEKAREVTAARANGAGGGAPS